MTKQPQRSDDATEGLGFNLATEAPARTPANPVRLAVFSDVHGNLQGLLAVLEDIEQRDAGITWCAGDLVGYGANPGEVIETIRGRGIPTVMGNYDDGVGNLRDSCGCDYKTEGEVARGRQSLAWTQARLSGDQKAFLQSLPHRLEREILGHRVILVHGSPAHLNEYLREATAEDVYRRHLAASGADVLIFGHTHRPYHRVLDGRHLVNAGSAGKPKHGSPDATYALLTFRPDGEVKVELVQVPYDHGAAARAVEAAGLPQVFADELREGQG